MIDEKIKALDDEKHALLGDIEALNNLGLMIEALKDRITKRASNIQHFVMHSKVDGDKR